MVETVRSCGGEEEEAGGARKARSGGGGEGAGRQGAQAQQKRSGATKAASSAQEERRKDEARATLSDTEARIMKMGDGSYGRPTTCRSRPRPMGPRRRRIGDRPRCRYGLLTPALDEVQQRYDVTRQRVLADGGYFSKTDIERLHARGVELFDPCPGTAEVTEQPSGVTGRHHRWRQRMTAEPAKPSTTALRHRETARHMRNHGLRRLLVRGIDKVKAVVLWHVHAFNFLQFKRLGLV